MVHAQIEAPVEVAGKVVLELVLLVFGPSKNSLGNLRRGFLISGAKFRFVVATTGLCVRIGPQAIGLASKEP